MQFNVNIYVMIRQSDRKSPEIVIESLHRMSTFFDILQFKKYFAF
jgi:hypothetical protein